MNEAKIIQGQFLGGKPNASFKINAAGVIKNNFIQRKVNIPIPFLQQRSNTVNAFKIDSNKLNLNGSGQPISKNVLQKMESLFNSDFSSVRIHKDGGPAESIGAIAFTTGRNIYFARGQYNPDNSHGQRLLAHELTHVIQQRSGRVKNPFSNYAAVINDPGLEAEAERMGIKAVTSIPIQTKSIQLKSKINIVSVDNSGSSQKLSVLVDGKSAGSVEVRNVDNKTSKLVNLYVDENYRGIGAGKALVDAAKGLSRQMGKSKVTLESQDNGSGKLNKWYQKLGFIRTGVGKKGYSKMEASSGIVQNKTYGTNPSTKNNLL